VLSLYGGNDARVDMTIPPAAQELKRLGKSFDYTMFEGAGHAFFRVQDGQSGANLKATQQAWPRMVTFLKKNLESSGVSRFPGYRLFMESARERRYLSRLAASK
jgi:dienelactone hydrolase